MTKYFKVEGIYHSKVNTETFEFETFATKLGRVLYKKAIEDETFIALCMNSKEYDRVEITETEYNQAKALFISNI
jgi:hypothetical protein